MDRTELGGIIRETNRMQVEARRQETRDQLSAAHKKAGDLATQLLDFYKVEPTFGYHGSGRKTYRRITPLIPLGEIEPNNQLGLTHGFAEVSVGLGMAGIIKRRGKFAMLLAGPFAYREEILDPSPTDEITKVEVLLFNGTPDHTSLFPSEKKLETTPGYTGSLLQNLEDAQLSYALRDRTEVVEILEILVSETIGANDGSSE